MLENAELVKLLDTVDDIPEDDKVGAPLLTDELDKLFIALDSAGIRKCNFRNF